MEPLVIAAVTDATVRAFQIAIVVGIALIVGIAVWAFMRRHRSSQLKDTFGAEYDRTVDTNGSRKEAEAELRQRIDDRERLAIRPLHPAVREKHLLAWERTQAHFVDSPTLAAREADELVTEVMRERGYPVDDFDRQEATMSVDHPDVVEHYRKARVAVSEDTNGQTDTEHLRRAMVHYRALFHALVDDGQTEQESTDDRSRAVGSDRS